MAYSAGEVRRWNTGGLTTTSSAIAERQESADKAGHALTDGSIALAEGWEGIASETVLNAADAEKRHVTALASYLDDLNRVLKLAADALEPAVQNVRTRITEAHAAGLVVNDTTITPAPGRDDITPTEVAAHADAISSALDTAASLDQHYGARIDQIAGLLQGAIPPEVNRDPIPGPDESWPGVGVGIDALTGAMNLGLQNFADSVDPLTRRRHLLNSVPHGREVSTGLRWVSKLAGPLGSVATIYDGVNRYARGEARAGEAVTETGGALLGGSAGMAGTGLLAGSYLGPHAAILGAAAGAAAGSPLGRTLAELAYESVTEHHDLLLEQYYYAI